MTNLIEIPNYRQTTDYTCGATSLLSILVYYGFYEDTEMSLAKKLNTDPEWGTDPEDIKHLLTEYGFEIESRNMMSFSDLEMIVNAKMPVLITYQAWSESDAHWSECWEDGHYSVVIGIDDKNVYLEDPSITGEIGYIPRKEFLDRWHDIDRNGNELNQFGLVIMNCHAKPKFQYRKVD
jgi:predicted double-glycine peptidase